MEKPNQQNNHSCPICLSKIKHNTVTQPCHHSFCHSCILQWSQTENTCPVCKQRFQRLIKQQRKKKQIRQKQQTHLQKKQIIDIQPKTRDTDNQQQEYLFSLMYRPNTRNKQLSFLQMYCLLQEIAEE